MSQDFINKNSNEEFDHKTTISVTDNSNIVSENYRQKTSLLFYYDNTSYVGEDGKNLETKEHRSNFDSDHPSWWEF